MDDIYGYHDRKYIFGKRLLTLRTVIGISQFALATAVGVHRRTIQNWENGESYPKIEALERLIAVLLEYGAFGAGQEREEAYALWQHAAKHGRYPIADFNEAWFASLGDKQTSRHETRDTRPESDAYAQPPAFPLSRSPGLGIIDWGEAIAVPTLYGRDRELNILHQWIVNDHSRVVSIVSLGGMGKSSLVLTFAKRVVSQFDRVVYRSLQNAPTCNDILDQIIRVIAEPQVTPPVQETEKIGLLVQLFRERRYLLILDNFETILQADALTGTYRPGYAAYGTLLQRLSEREHRSCLVLTSREKPAELGVFEGRTTRVRTLSLVGLDEHACDIILKNRDIVGTAADVVRLTRLYGGNPLALHLVTEPIRELFGGDVNAFLSTGDPFFNGLRNLMEQQCARSTPLELAIMRWLAVERELMPLSSLFALLRKTAPQREILVALESLRRRVQIEHASDQAAFTLHPTILEFVTDQMVGLVGQEIITEQPGILHTHSLIQATTNDYLRISQERLIATPLLEQLISMCGGAEVVEQHLLNLLDFWRGKPLTTHGFGPGNVINLLRVLRGHLRALDLTGLLIQQAYLQGVDMQATRLDSATIEECIFTEVFDAPLAVAMNRSGSYWAASIRSGEVVVWAAGSQTLYRKWRAHTDMIWTLAFSPDGRTLATGSWDGTVKLWEVTSGGLIWTGRHTSHINSIAFAPDGTMLASGGNEGMIRFWDVASGAQLLTLPHPGPASGAGITWSPDGRLLASGDTTGSIRVWKMQEQEHPICIYTIAAHTAFVDGLAFSPDGSILASASWDGTVKLWNVTDGHLQQALIGHTGRMGRVVWSPDGRTLAVSGYDPLIWLWDVDQASYRTTLQGHTDGVCGLAFTPDNRTLLSCGNGTIRLWNVASGQCLRVIQGYEDILSTIDWSPDGTHLVSGGLDARVTIWDMSGTLPPTTLQGHTESIGGVSWSPDGRWIASSEWGNTIRLWKPTSGESFTELRHPNDSGNFFYGVAWNPDGQRLASGTSRHGVQVWDIASQHPSWAEESFPTFIRHVAWRSDGAQIAGGGDDGTVYIWDATDGTLLQQLVGHHSMITDVAWSPEGTRLASGGRGTEGGELFVWDMTGDKPQPILMEHSSIVYALARGANENELISGSGDGKLHWWDVPLRTCVHEHEAHRGTVQALKRNPDGTCVASCGDDGKIAIWDIQHGCHLQTVCRDRPYQHMTITGLTGLTDVQRTSLIALGAIDEQLNK